MENICKNFQADYKIYVFYAWDNVLGPLKNDYDKKKLQKYKKGNILKKYLIIIFLANVILLKMVFCWKLKRIKVF